MASTVTAMPSKCMSEAEWQTRLDLAACYRLVDLFGWSDLINTRITARVPGQDGHFLINPLRPPVRRDYRVVAGQDRCRGQQGRAIRSRGQ
jgi:hypothetical protein